MKVNIKQAIKLFFSNPSLDMVFIEAIANSLDANATKIDICINIEELGRQETLQVSIKDDGTGFTDERYEKFCKLLQVEDNTHKGVGRLVYLYYFDKIEVSSKFNNKHRVFTYDSSFDEDNSNMKVADLKNGKQETILNFSDCSLRRLSSYNAILPEFLKKKILEEFLPRLYLYKEENRNIEIDIEINVNKIKKNQAIGSRKANISLQDLPTLELEKIDASQIRWFEDMELQYYIKKNADIVSSYQQIIFRMDMNLYSYCVLLFLMDKSILPAKV
jgi:hypothetical protein